MRKVFALLLLFAAPVFAQEENQMIRWYVMPSETVTINGRQMVRPAFLPYSTAQITSVINDNPVRVITAVPHNLNTGNRVEFGAVRPDETSHELNGARTTVTVIGANELALDGIDGSGFGDFGRGRIGYPLWGWNIVRDGWGIGWVDLDLAQHQAYNAAQGTLFLTNNLNATLTQAQVNGLVTRLQARNLPSAWVNTTLTWRVTIKRLLAYIQCIQRFWGETRQSLNIGRPVTTLVSSLSQSVRDRLDAVATTLALPPVQPGDTIETMMNRWADTIVTRPIFVGGVEF